MRWLWCLLFLIIPQCAEAWTHGGDPFPPPTASVICTFSGAGAGNCSGIGGGTSLFTAGTCNGSADDSAAFASFNTWAVGTWQASHSGWIELDLIGTCTFLTNTGSNFTAGVKQLYLKGYGATMTTLGSSSVIFNFGTSPICQQGITQGSGCSARTATANIGDTSVTLSASASGVTLATLCARFSVGGYAMMSGYDLQGEYQQVGGYPVNAGYIDYVKITNTSSCASTGVISFDRALTHKYESTWPLFNSGDNGHADQGGPATIYALTNWDQDLYVAGVTIDQTANQTSSQIRSVVYRDVTVTGTACIYPSEGLSWVVVNSQLLNCNIEADKGIVSSTVISSTISAITFQTGGFSNDTFTLKNSTITSSIQGTPRKFIGQNSTIAQLKFGALAYGRTDEVDCTNCTINSLIIHGSVGMLGGWTMSGGTITIPNIASQGTNQNQVRWAMPGTNFMWNGSLESMGLYHVVDVTQDATNTYIQTDCVGANTLCGVGGGFPVISGQTINAVMVHPAPQVTFRNCNGSDPLVASLNQAPAGAPLYSYQTYTYTGAVGTTPQVVFDLWGNLSQANFNVTNAYSGTASINLTQFNNWPMLTASSTFVNWNSSGSGPAINVHSVGNRQLTLAGSSCVSGSCTGDSGLSVPDATYSWFAGLPGAGATFSTNTSASCPGAGCPSITVTMQTNQGVVNP